MHRLHDGSHLRGKQQDMRLSIHLSIHASLNPSHPWCLQGSFFRLYYPCQEIENAEKPDWVPCMEYFNGLADFMKINRTLSERIFNYLFGNLTTFQHMQNISLLPFLDVPEYFTFHQCFPPLCFAILLLFRICCGTM